MKITQIDENTIQVEKEETKTTINNYNYDFLLSQKDAIQKQADDYTAQRQKELDEVNELIGESDKLGLKPIKINPNPIEIKPIGA